jgi:hypothetical protein
MYTETIISEIATATEGPYAGPSVGPGITPEENLRTYTYSYSAKQGDSKQFSITNWELYILLEGATEDTATANWET